MAFAYYVSLQDTSGSGFARTDNYDKFQFKIFDFYPCTACSLFELMPVNHTHTSHFSIRLQHWPCRLLLVLPALLTACGGGGSDNTPSAAAAPSAAAVTTPSAAATSIPASAASQAISAAPASSSDASCGLNAPGGIQAEMLQRVNAMRASGAVCGSVAYPTVGALSWNTTLLQAAKGHATDMATNNYFSHTGRDGRSPAERVLAAGYSYGQMGENIAAGQPTVESAMAAWTASASHCQNMMTPDFRDIAVACVRNDSATYRIYWVMEMARPL
jgi:uncharacterized protein YkwD